MSHQDDNNDLIQIHRRRLHKLRIKQAYSGLNDDPETILEIEDIEAKIKELEGERSELEEIGKLPIVHYLDKILDKPLTAFGDLLGDTVYYWQLRNKVNVILKSKHYLESKGINPEKILPDVFIPLLEDAASGSVGTDIAILRDREFEVR